MSTSEQPSGQVAARPRVVFLHGQPGTAMDWDPVLAQLPPDFESVTLDRPGYSDNPNPPSDLEGNARWLIDALDESGTESAILVGHSFGGGVALAAAALAPERVSGLVLVSSVGPDCLDGWDALLASPFAGPLLALVAFWWMPWFARWRLARLERRSGRQLRADEHLNWDVLAKAQHRHGAMWRTFLTEQRALVRGVDALDDYIERTTAPTVVIADRSDRMVPMTTAKALHERLATSRLVVTSGGGHHLPRRRPAVIADEIRRLAATV